MEYKVQLKTPQWRAKSYHILQRDNFTCQNCGKRGIQNDPFFPISQISDLDMMFPIGLFAGKTLSEMIKGIELPNDYKFYPTPVPIYEIKTINDNLFVNQFKLYSIWAYPDKIATTEPLNCIHVASLYDSCPADELSKDKYYKYQGEYVYPRIRIFRIKESLGTQNYASVSCYKKEKSYKLSIKFTMDNNYYDITLSGLDNHSDFKTLNVHHKYYIKGHKAWEYEDDALVTLCTECHSSIHKDIVIKTPLYNEVRDLIKDNLPLCPRCNGKGYLPEYAYNENGICFKCWGEGITGYE